MPNCLALLPVDKGAKLAIIRHGEKTHGLLIQSTIAHFPIVMTPPRKHQSSL